MIRPFQPPKTEGQSGGSAIVDRAFQAVKWSLDTVQQAIDQRVPATPATGKPLLSGSPNAFGTTSAPSDSSERLSVDLVPSYQASGAVATGTGRNEFVAIAPSTQVTMIATCTCWGASEIPVFTSTLLIRAYRTAGGAATILGSPVVLHTSGSGFTFTAPASGGAVLLETLNSSGAAADVQVFASITSARTRSM